MLKWLKQKPLDGHGHGQNSLAVSENITDDPLAALQVQPKSSSKKLAKPGNGGGSGNNEIYAVSRVNPLFEEEDSNVAGGKGGISPGNQSASSGYDSGPSDDDSLNKKPQYDYINPPEPGNRLFARQEDVIIHHEATIVDGGVNYLTTNGHPVLQILNQNTNFVKNIAVALNRPLTPIDESIVDGATGRKSVCSIPVPTRNAVSTNPGDSIGVAKVLQRNKNYVQSIRIGPGPVAGQQRRQDVEYPSGAGRKPSVTFSEKVDFADGRGSRRTSTDQDSIVTESLLMMTSNNQQQQEQHHKHDLLLQEVRARRHRIMKSETDATVVSRPDLTDFSQSLSKNRIVLRQIGSNSNYNNNALHPGDAADEMRENNNDGSGDDDDDANIRDEDPYNSGDRSDSSSSVVSAKSQTPSSRRGRSISSASSTTKSAFGGIADHYAAAKEIAKEIESYSTGSGKSMGISLVRDLLLSNRGRSHSSSTSSSFSFKQNKDQKDVPGTSNRFGAGTLVSTVIQVQQATGVSRQSPPPPPLPGPGYRRPNQRQPIPSDKPSSSSPSSSPWVHPQVYVKANGMTTTTTDPNVNVRGRRRDEEYEGQDQVQQVPIYEILPGAARLRHEDSDSGNSTDRCPKDTRLEEEPDDSESERHFDVETTDPLPSDPDQNATKSISKSELSRASSSGSNNDKVMIVTGDSQNMVVDLSAVPLDLREAIISGTALMTFPDGLRQLVDPGYTMITIPSDDHAPIRNEDYGTKNKAQFWDNIQNGSSDAGSKGYRGKDKKQLTHLPYHPNHDSHTTPDFTLDGHRLAIQTRKVKKGKKRRCLCRICGMIFFLAAFLGVIVTLSLIYTNGQRYFGSA